METRHTQLRRIRFTSRKSFDEVVEGLYTGIGRPKMIDFNRSMASARTLPEVERIVNEAVGKADLLEFLRLDLGRIVSMGASGVPCRMVRILTGNPLIMRQMALAVPDAGSYAPITILVYEAPNGEVSVCYDQVADALSIYDSRPALQVASDLDKKVIDLIKKAVS